MHLFYDGPLSFNEKCASGSGRNQHFQRSYSQESFPRPSSKVAGGSSWNAFNRIRDTRDGFFGAVDLYTSGLRRIASALYLRLLFIAQQ